MYWFLLLLMYQGKKAQDFIRAGYVKVNHIVLDESSYLCNNNSVISIRGHGRFHFKEVIKRTKKDHFSDRNGKISVSKGDDMEKRVFDTMKNGYNRYQVDDYIHSLAEEIESLRKKLECNNVMMERLSKEKDDLEKKYKEVSDNLYIKEQAAGEMARMAMKEANMIVDTANQNAETIIKEALMMARGILLDISRLGNEARDMKGNMQEELERIREALENFETPAIPDLNLLKKKNCKARKKTSFCLWILRE